MEEAYSLPCGPGTRHPELVGSEVEDAEAGHLRSRRDNPIVVVHVRGWAELQGLVERLEDSDQDNSEQQGGIER